jgi:hypothetical protein
MVLIQVPKSGKIVDKISLKYDSIFSGSESVKQ